MIGMPGNADITASTGAIWPNRSTGMHDFVRDVRAAAAASGRILNVSGSMSTNTGVAPTL